MVEKRCFWAEILKYLNNRVPSFYLMDDGILFIMTNKNIKVDFCEFKYKYIVLKGLIVRSVIHGLFFYNMIKKINGTEDDTYETSFDYYIRTSGRPY